MRRWITPLLSILLSGCASVAPVPDAKHLFHDRLFAAAREPVGASDIFAVSADMQRYLDTEIKPRLHAKGAQKALVDALYTRGQLKLDYDASITRNAAQTFSKRAGNCLSLVIMTAAFARQLGLPVQYQSVFLDGTWSRSRDIFFLSGHVNLILGAATTSGRARLGSAPMTIDFLPPELLRNQHALSIPEQTISAMYMNNQAAEALVDARLDEAYGWARAAIRTGPTFFSSYNTLGVIYQQHGNLEEAKQAFRFALRHEPENTQALSNLIGLLERTGHRSEAKRLQERLAKIEPYPPYYFFDQGKQAMQAGDYKRARGLFTREISRAAYHHEFHFWLALAELHLGKPWRAERHMATALENSTTPTVQSLYAAKLDLIKAYNRQ